MEVFLNNASKIVDFVWISEMNGFEAVGIKYTLKPHIKDWIEGNCNGKYKLIRRLVEMTHNNTMFVPVISFELDSDAMMFKLAIPIEI